MDVPYKPIDCNRYDFIEIACLYRYEIILTLVDGTTRQGIATNTEITDGQEFIVLKVGTELKRTRLDTLSSLQVLSEPREFDRVDFTTG